MKETSEHELIEQLYEVAASPEKYDEYMISLAKRINSIDSGAPLVETAAINGHIERASALVDVITPWRLDTDDELHQQLALRMQAMLAVDSSGNIVEANMAAKTVYDLKPTSTLNELPLSSDESDSLLKLVKRVVMQGHGANSTGDVTRLTNVASGRPMLVTLEFYNSQQKKEQLAVVKSSDIGWPSHLNPILASLFNLSRAEIEVVQLIVEGDKVEQIAHRRCCSVPTVRSQLRSIFSKTDTKSQLDCVRMIFGLALMHDNEKGGEVAARLQSEFSVTCYPTEANRRLLQLQGDRQIEYSVFGAEKGPAILFYHCMVFGDVWFKEAADAARLAGFRVLAPLRPGYGRTSTYDGAYSDPRVFANDVQQLMDYEKIEEAVVFSVSSGFVHALALANCEPTRIKSVLGTTPKLPTLTDADLEGTSGYSYLIPHTRLHFPSALKFFAKAGFAFVSKSGHGAFIKAVLRSSQRDVEWACRPDILPILEHGKAVHRVQGYVGIFGDISYPEDWTDLMVNSPVPVRIVIGENDRNVQWNAAKRWNAELEHVTLHVLPNSGFLVHHQHYSTIIKWFKADVENG